MANKIRVDKLLTVDDTGMPKAPDIRQILDKDVQLLWLRDKTKDKSQYIKEVGVIYYLADPKGPCKQEGLSDNEAIKKAIENFDLPVNYKPDLLVWKLAKRYYEAEITVAGAAVETLLRSIHNVVLAANKMNEMLTDKLNGELSIEDSNTVIGIMDNLNKKTAELPNIMKALNTAKENLLYEEEQQTARGGVTILSSMTEE
jgi:hypothetical protein|nr:MAG TPA: hypothetical protein [Crassvirales sp.]